MSDRQSRLSDSWEANADAWTRAVRESLIESRRVATNAAILDTLVALQPARVLDVGCGEGWLVRALGERGIRAVGVDGSEALIRAARACGAGEYHHLRYRDFDALPRVAGDDVDVGVCNFSLLDDDIAPVLRAIAGVLTPRGRLVVQTVHPWSASADQPYENGWRTESFTNLPTPFPATMPWYFRTLSSWCGELRSATFLIEQIDEPRHPATGQPLSLIITAAAAQTPT